MLRVQIFQADVFLRKHREDFEQPSIFRREDPAHAVHLLYRGSGLVDLGQKFTLLLRKGAGLQVREKNPPEFRVVPGIKRSLTLACAGGLILHACLHPRVIFKADTRRVEPAVAVQFGVYGLLRPVPSRKLVLVEVLVVHRLTSARTSAACIRAACIRRRYAPDVELERPSPGSGVSHFATDSSTIFWLSSVIASSAPGKFGFVR